MSTNTIKRQHIFIKKAFQGRFILGVFLLILLSSFCSAMLIYWLTGGDLQAQSQTAHVNIMNAWQRLGLSIFIGNFIAFLVAGTLAVFVVLYASHKIAGPLYRFEVLCEQVGNGQLDTITTLREKDQLQDLAQAFTNMVGQLKSKRNSQQASYSQIAEQLQTFKTSAGGLSEEQLATVSRLEELVRQLQQ